MRIGMFVSEARPQSPSTVQATIDNACRAEALGLATAWVPHVPWSLDALTALALAGAHTSRIELGTGVVPTWSRHPYAMAQQALTTQAACDGRLLLGIGPSHQSVAEDWYGASYEKVIYHVREYVGVLEACFGAQASANTRTQPSGGAVEFQGDRFRVHSTLEVPGGTPVPIYLAALAPLMLRLAGERAAGTITWMGDERTHGDYVVPRLQQAARRAGRPMPRVIAGLPIAVCDDVDEGRRRAETIYGRYGQIPAYARMLARGEAKTPAEVALVGDERHITSRLEAYESAGVSDLCAMVFAIGPDGRERTEQLLASLAATR